MTKCVGIDLAPDTGSTTPRFASSGLPLKLRPCLDNQGGVNFNVRWKLDTINSPTTIVAAMKAKDGTDSCMDVPGFGTTSGLELQIWTCKNITPNGTTPIATLFREVANQRWTISRP